MGQVNPNSIKQSYSFIENKGQWDSDVLFLAKSNSLRVWITKKSMVFEQFEVANTNENDRNSKQDKEIKAYAIALEFQNSKNADVEKLREGKTKLNYFIGNDKSKHKTGVMQYEEVMLKGIYEGIDMRYYFDEGEVRYDYIVQPYSDPTQIELEIKGSQENKLENGELVMKTSMKPVIKQGLYAYQKNSDDSKQTVNSSFVLTGNKLKLNIGEYDKSKVLVIDPMVLISGHIYYNYEGYDKLSDISHDNQSDLIFCGSTNSHTFPTTFGTYNAAFDAIIGCKDFINNINNWVTYLGGSNDDYAISIDVKSNGIYFTGVTASHDFPLFNEYYSDIEGTYSNYFTVLNTIGNAIIYSTYLGNESGNSTLASIKALENRTVYLSGSAGTNQTNPYVENNEILTQTRTYNPDKQVGFVMCFEDQSSFNYINSFSTLFGGDDFTEIRDLGVDTNGNIYLTGITKSSSHSFDTTLNAYCTINNLGNKTNFVTKLKFGTTNIEIDYNTFFGDLGPDENEGSQAILFYDNLVYVGGYSTIDGIPKKNAFDTLFSAPDYEAFITAFVLSSSQDDDLVYSSYFGDSFNSRISKLDYDWHCNQLLFIGNTYSNLNNFLGHLWEPFKGDSITSNLMIGAININNSTSTTLEEIAYFADSLNVTDGSIDYLPSSSLIYASGNIINDNDSDILLFSVNKSYCSALKCPCPSETNSDWFSVSVERVEGTCDSTDCFVSHTIELPNVVLNCYHYVEFSSFLDTNSFVEPTIYKLDTFNISNLDLCIKSGTNYTAQFRLLTYPDSPEDCLIIKEALCPVLRCPCPDSTELWLGVIVGLDSGMECDSNECYVSHFLNNSYFNDLCTNYLEYSLFIDSALVDGPVKVSLDTFEISSLNRCISIGEKYEISVKIRANPTDSVYCEAYGRGFCRENNLEPCYPDYEDVRFEDTDFRTYNLPNCPGCSVKVYFTHRTGQHVNDLQILRIDLLEQACSECTIESIYEDTFIMLLTDNPMGMSDYFFRVANGGCFGRWEYIVSDGGNTFETIYSWELCDTMRCCWQHLVIDRDEEGIEIKLGVSETNVNCFQINIENSLGELIPCIPACDWNANLYGYYEIIYPEKRSIESKTLDFSQFIGIKVENHVYYLDFKVRINEPNFIKIKSFDLLGNEIFSHEYFCSQYENNFSMDIQNYKIGTYLYSIELNGIMIKSGKFIKY